MVDVLKSEIRTKVPLSTFNIPSLVVGILVMRFYNFPIFFSSSYFGIFA